MSDFVAMPEIAVPFTLIDDDSDTDFVDIGDAGVIIVSGLGFGEGGFGEGGFGGNNSFALSNPTTQWTQINTP